METSNTIIFGPFRSVRLRSFHVISSRTLVHIPLSCHWQYLQILGNLSTYLTMLYSWYISITMGMNDRSLEGGLERLVKLLLLASCIS